MSTAIANDSYQLALGRKAAEALKAEPARLEVARQRVAEWIAKGPYHCPEWEALLARGDVEEISAILEADTEDGQRLRSSSPFIGEPFFTRSEAQRIHEQIFA